MAEPPAPPRRRRASATPRRLPYLLIAPAALLGFIACPVLSVFYYSLENYSPTKPWRNGFAGLGNFTQIFAHDPRFRDTLTFSAKWVVVEAGLQPLFGLAPALIVNQTLAGRALGRALVFSPWAGNDWDSGVSAPSIISTDVTATYGARKPDGSLPDTTFLTTGSNDDRRDDEPTPGISAGCPTRPGDPGTGR